MLSFYRRLLEIRKQEPALQTGEYIPAYSDNQIFAYMRRKNDTCFLIILNFSHLPCYFRPKQMNYKGQVMFSTETEREENMVKGSITLSGDEGLLVRID